MDNNINKIFKKRTCLSATELEGYVRNTLKARKRNQVERHLLDCELCSEALDGFVESGKEINLVRVKSSLAHRFVSENSLGRSGVRKNNGWIWAAAAVVCLALVSGLVWKFNQKQNNDLAVMQVNDSIQEEVESMSPVKEESDVSAKSSTLVSEPEVIDRNKRTESQKSESLSDAAKISVYGEERSHNVREDKAVYEATDDLKADDKQAESQPVAPEIYDNAYKPSSDDNNVTVLTQAALKKKSEAASRMTGNKELSISWNEIFKLAEHGQYQRALLFVEQLQHEKDELKKSYYKGFYLYKLERYTEAILQFEKLRKEISHSHYHDAQFYRAMSLISTGKNKEGKEILTRIAKEKLPHYEHAVETLRFLD